MKLLIFAFLLGWIAPQPQIGQRDRPVMNPLSDPFSSSGQAQRQLERRIDEVRKASP